MASNESEGSMALAGLVQIGSRQRMTMVCPDWPGATVISRRTSRKPLRLPVTVYLPGFR